jgi:hypothetical protein
MNDLYTISSFEGSRHSEINREQELLNFRKEGERHHVFLLMMSKDKVYIRKECETLFIGYKNI